MIPVSRTRRQMSDSLLTASFIVFSGGLQDAYTYVCRDKVFANAQTGNMVLMSTNFFEGNFAKALQYFVPILAFALGVFTVECVHRRCAADGKLHWRQHVLASEILLLAVVGFLPQACNMLANVIVSFVAAMQVEAFRKVHGYGYASTMCTGNLRSGTESLANFLFLKDEKAIHRSRVYFGVIAIFILGAGCGAWLTARLGEKTVWISCALLAVSFFLMFSEENLSGRRNKEEENS